MIVMRLLAILVIFSFENKSNEVSRQRDGVFSLRLTTYNHADRIHEGTWAYEFEDDTLVVRRYPLFSIRDSIMYSTMVEDSWAEDLKSLKLDTLKDFYFNHCVMVTSGNEYQVTMKRDDIMKKIDLHYYYHVQIEALVEAINRNIPARYSVRYLPKETEQDCFMGD